jgi:hypothetical protein
VGDGDAPTRGRGSLHGALVTGRPDGKLRLVAGRMVQRNEEKADRRYLPSLFAGPSDGRISPGHASCEADVTDIPGKLEPADHLKLYECAYFARGPIPEIGRLHGKSTTVLALATEEAGHEHRIPPAPASGASARALTAAPTWAPTAAPRRSSAPPA